jgi:tetratricopeptide (TPR) repeat protein
MSEELESTQPNQPADMNSTARMKAKVDDTQPRQPIQMQDQQPAEQEPQPPVVKKPSRWRSILIGIVGFLALIGLGGFGGYNAGVGARQNAANDILSQQLSEQFTFALVDIEFGRYDNARQRLEFIIQNDPSFPGAQEKLTEVLVLSNVPTPTVAPTPTATPDFSGAESAFARAQELTRAQDWNGALTALDTIRKLDPNYKAAQVDGMYYFALRNKGYDLITKEGNLEGGIYYITLAERFGPLDNTARGLRDGARAYMVGASFWELDWEQARNNFEQVAAGWPSMWDGTMTAAQRYVIASVRFADELYNVQAYCEAYDEYANAAAIGQLDGEASARQAQAYSNCYPATEAPVEAPPATEAPTEAPTAAP